MLWKPLSIERGDSIQRARQTAAISRVGLGVFGILLILAHPALLPLPAWGIAGFAIIVLTALRELADPRITWVQVEEPVDAAAAILIIGLGNQQVTVMSLLWLIALTVGVMACGGRVHSIGRLLVMIALALPILREGSLSLEYAAFFAALIGLQVTAGRLTLELYRLLREARHDADNAETLLLAGEIASRVADVTTGGVTGRPSPASRPQPAARTRRRGRPHPPRARPPDRRRRAAHRRPADRRPAHRSRPRLRGAGPLWPSPDRPQPAALAGDRRAAGRTPGARARLPDRRARPLRGAPRRHPPRGQPLDPDPARPGHPGAARRLRLRTRRPARGADRRDHRGDAGRQHPRGAADRRRAARPGRPARGRRRRRRLLGAAPDHRGAARLPEARPLAGRRDRHRPRPRRAGQRDRRLLAPRPQPARRRGDRAAGPAALGSSRSTCRSPRASTWLCPPSRGRGSTWRGSPQRSRARSSSPPEAGFGRAARPPPPLTSPAIHRITAWPSSTSRCAPTSPSPRSTT